MSTDLTTTPADDTAVTAALRAAWRMAPSCAVGQ